MYTLVPLPALLGGVQVNTASQLLPPGIIIGVPTVAAILPKIPQ